MAVRFVTANFSPPPYSVPISYNAAHSKLYILAWAAGVLFVTHSASLPLKPCQLIVLALLSLPCQRTARESSENAATLYSATGLRSTTPTGNILETPELGTPGVPMVSVLEGFHCSVWSLKGLSIRDTISFQYMAGIIPGNTMLKCTFLIWAQILYR